MSVKANTNPNIVGSVVDSAKGWPLDEHWPDYRAILSPVAIHHGYFFNTPAPDEMHINEWVHWSALAKRTSSTRSPYSPPNLPSVIPLVRIAAVTQEDKNYFSYSIDAPLASGATRTSHTKRAAVYCSVRVIH
jgi:hypothetical protein